VYALEQCARMVTRQGVNNGLLRYRPVTGTRASGFCGELHLLHPTCTQCCTCAGQGPRMRIMLCVLRVQIEQRDRLIVDIRGFRIIRYG
jgi:hypothetical protein